MSKVRLASGRGYSFHYDFINAWDPATLAALVKHCINGGLQCNARGFDEFHPQLRRRPQRGSTGSRSPSVAHGVRAGGAVAGSTT
jgi:hypothetical protein